MYKNDENNENGGALVLLQLVMLVVNLVAMHENYLAGDTVGTIINSVMAGFFLALNLLTAIED